jgi:hypothetical protein
MSEKNSPLFDSCIEEYDSMDINNPEIVKKFFEFIRVLHLVSVSAFDQIDKNALLFLQKKLLELPESNDKTSYKKIVNNMINQKKKALEKKSNPPIL